MPGTHTLWIEECEAVVACGTMHIVCRSGGVEYSSRMSLATFRRYAEQGLRDLNTHESGTNILPFGKLGEAHAATC